MCLAMLDVNASQQAKCVKSHGSLLVGDYDPPARIV
ncbi:MAG: hypothetical protein ACI9BS_000842 [Candidatus Poriferisodalaceae bacterium]